MERDLTLRLPHLRRCQGAPFPKPYPPLTSAPWLLSFPKDFGDARVAQFFLAAKMADAGDEAGFEPLRVRLRLQALRQRHGFVVTRASMRFLSFCVLTNAPPT